MNNLRDRIWSPIKTRSFFMSMRVHLLKNPKVTLMNLWIHHPLVLGKCNKSTSFLEIYVIMVRCKCSWLSKYFWHILLHFGTNLAARIDGTTISGVAGVYITYHGCNKKTPHGQTCDHKQALSGDSPDSYKKKSLLLNK